MGETRVQAQHENFLEKRERDDSARVFFYYGFLEFRNILILWMGMKSRKKRIVVQLIISHHSIKQTKLKNMYISFQKRLVKSHFSLAKIGLCGDGW